MTIAVDKAKGLPGPTVISRDPIHKEEAMRFLPEAWRNDPAKMDPYFPAAGALCGLEHVAHVLGVMYPLLYGYRSIIVGQRAMTTYTLLGMFAVGDRDPDHLGAGHVFYLGLPGTGKSLLAKVPQKMVDAICKRIQGTVDLLPSDITGSSVVQVDEETGRRRIEFIRGPVFSNLLLVDEASRIPARSQSGLLESMSEGQVTYAGKTYHGVEPFVIMTGNPIESEGVHKMSDALLDRVMFQVLAQPFTAKDFSQINERTRRFHMNEIKLEQITNYERIKEARLFFHNSVHVSQEANDFVGRLSEALNRVDELGLLGGLRRKMEFSDHDNIIKPGSAIISGRGAPHLEGAARTLAALSYRNYMTVSDVRKVLLPVIRHRAHFTTTALFARESVESELKQRFQGRSGKTEMAEYLLEHIIAAAWDHASVRR